MEHNNSAPVNFVEGDIFYLPYQSQYNVYKVLAIETGVFKPYHVLLYKPLDTLPVIADVDRLEFWVLHAPFDKQAFADAKFLVNKRVNSSELSGYHEYLRQTKDTSYQFAVTLEYYWAGSRLTDEKQYHEAIDSYSKAIDLFPEFTPAIEGRAFCKMDLGLWLGAIADFQLSAQEGPDSPLEEFFIGECYFEMNDFETAKQHFLAAIAIDPLDEPAKQFLDMIHSRNKS